MLVSNPKGDLLAVIVGRRFIVINVESGEIILSPAGQTVDDAVDAHKDVIKAASFNHDSTLLATCADDKEIRLWDLRQGKCISIRKSSKRPSSCAFGRLGKSDAKEEVLVVGDKTGEVTAYPVPNIAEKSKVLLGHTASIITSLVFSNGDEYLLSADRDEKIRISHFPKTERIEAFCLGHREFVGAIAIPKLSPDLVVSCSGDCSIRLWRYKEGKEVDAVFLDDTHKQSAGAQDNREQTVVDDGQFLGDSPGKKRHREVNDLEEDKSKRPENWWEESDKDIPSCLAVCPKSNLVAVSTYSRSRIFLFQISTEDNAGKLVPLPSQPFIELSTGLKLGKEEDVTEDKILSLSFSSNGTLFVCLASSPYISAFTVSGTSMDNRKLVPVSTGNTIASTPKSPDSPKKKSGHASIALSEAIGKFSEEIRKVSEMDGKEKMEANEVDMREMKKIKLKNAYWRQEKDFARRNK